MFVYTLVLVLRETYRPTEWLLEVSNSTPLRASMPTFRIMSSHIMTTMPGRFSLMKVTRLLTCSRYRVVTP